MIVVKEELIEYYHNQKLSAEKISKIYNVSQPTILNWLKKYNTPRRTISKALAGRQLSENHKQKIAKTTKGKAPKNLEQFLEAAEKYKYKPGKEHPNFGQHHSDETKEKQRQKALGRKMTEDAKQKMSQAKKDLYNGDPKNHPRYGIERPDITGPNHFNWNNGITPLYKLIRETTTYKMWRKKCFERDCYTCQFCKQVGGTLHIDHIKPYSIIINENNLKTTHDALNCMELWDINNGRTLCISCHRKTETYGLGVKKFKANI